MAQHDLSLPARLAALWDHLGLGAAHVAAQMPGDFVEFLHAAPERIAGIVLCAPSRLDPAPFAEAAARLLVIAGEHGQTAELAARAERRLPGMGRAVLAGYEAQGWSDVVADRTEAVAAAIAGFLHDRAPAAASPSHPLKDGSHLGISYRIEGAGPALVLLPFFLAPSQWAPAVSALARHFTVITLGGRHLGGVAALEDRAQAPSYRAMVGALFDLLAPRPDARVLDIGSGSGALDRRFATRYPAAELIATDVNPFLLGEAGALAAEEGHAIAFQSANAEALPFPDAHFDAVFSVTVLEECDADRALGEIRRVLRPGGRAGVIVRAIDLPQWWNLDLPAELRERANTPPRSVGARGVADASLYRRMGAAGFERVTAMPALVTLDNPGGPIWRHREDHVLSQLTPEETTIWRGLTDEARAAGVLISAHGMHCAVGVKPG